MKLRHLIGRLQSPSCHAVVEIIEVAGQGRSLVRHQSIRFPTGTTQVWEFQAARPPLQGEPVVIAVFFQGKQIKSWQRLEKTFEQALQHYARQRHLREQRVVALQMHEPPAVKGIQVIMPASTRPAPLWKLSARGES
ncbi:MAG: hypothetical protein KDK04_00335 [Candidatus Competibacteraceae bacterium]|nr:hypothetical protein [Candidatus Competibacteraceae bacterium]MCB1803742.1 hypothetical protein [Candidatus Competibacteraceae bacterium]MCB1810161.1 hypothetical protein [Candidatus Competibacteraceae bacterium]